MARRPLLIFSIGFGTAWSVAALTGTTLGTIVGGVIGGAIAGLGVHIALGGPATAQIASRSRVIFAWSIAAVVGQAILRGIGGTLGYGYLGTCVWIAAATVSGAASGALGVLAMQLPVQNPGARSYSFSPTRLPAGLMLGGFAAGLLISYYPPVLGGLFGNVSGFMLRLGFAFFVAGAAMALIGALIASRRPRLS